MGTLHSSQLPIKDAGTPINHSSRFYENKRVRSNRLHILLLFVRVDAGVRLFIDRKKIETYLPFFNVFAGQTYTEGLDEVWSVPAESGTHW